MSLILFSYCLLAVTDNDALVAVAHALTRKVVSWCFVVVVDNGNGDGCCLALDDHVKPLGARGIRSIDIGTARGDSGSCAELYEGSCLVAVFYLCCIAVAVGLVVVGEGK